MVILKYVCGTFSSTIIEGRFVNIISAFIEKATHNQKFGTVIPVEPIFLPKPKNDERYP